MLAKIMAYKRRKKTVKIYLILVSFETYFSLISKKSLNFSDANLLVIKSAKSDQKLS